MKLFSRVMCCAAVCLGAFGQQSQEGETGIRARLEHMGVSFGLSYTAEASTDGAGAQYLGSLASTALFDLTHLGLGRGQVYVSAQALHGEGNNDRLIGAIQAPSNLDEKSFAKFIETWYSDSYLQGRLRIKAGRQYADTEFGAIENGGDFLNASYGVLPTAPMPTYPDPALGVALWAAPTRRVSLGVGVYRGGDLSGRAPFRVFEGRFQWPQRSTGRAGWWQQAGNHGAYVVAEHRFRDQGEQILAVFIRLGWAPAARNEVRAYAGGGLVYRGFGVGLSSVRPAAGNIESVYEVFYKHRFTEKIVLQPDLQRVVNPGGTGRRTFVAGVRVSVQL
jgi:porin